MSSFQVLNQITDTNGVTHDIQCIHRVTMDTTTSTATAFVVNTSSPESVTNLYDGLTIVCKNTKIASASGCTLNLNGLGAKRIWLSQGNGYCTTHWSLNQTYIFIYDETNTRWELQQGRDTDSNTYDRNKYTGTIKAGSTAIVAKNIIVADSDGLYKHLKLGTEFDIRYPILYANSAIAANATGTDNYDIIHFTITTTQNISLTAYKPVYIKGTMMGPYFTPVSTTPLTQTGPSDGDTNCYMILGIATSATTIYLTENHKILYWATGIGLVEYINYAKNSWWANRSDYSTWCYASWQTHTLTNKALGNWFNIGQIYSAKDAYFDEAVFVVKTGVGTITIPIFVPLASITATSESTAQSFRGGYSQGSTNGGGAYILIYINGTNFTAKLDQCYINGTSQSGATVDVYLK